MPHSSSPSHSNIPPSLSDKLFVKTKNLTQLQSLDYKLDWGLCCRCSANLVVKCQKSCNPHGGVCHLTPNCDWGGGGAMVKWWFCCLVAFLLEGMLLMMADWASNQLLIQPHVAKIFFCDTVSGRCVLSQKLSNLWHQCLYIRLRAHVCDKGISGASCLARAAVPLASYLRVILSPHVASFLWKWISHCFIKFSSLSVSLTSTLFLCGGFWPLGVRPNRTENSAIHNQEEGKEMALLV